MSKRFTETDKWRDPWFRKLTPLQKCLFVYLCDNCNNAGFVEIDVEGWCLYISCKPKDLEAAWEGLIRGFIVNGGWAFIRNYLKHQKHIPLDPDRNPAHRQIANMFREQESRFPGLLEKLINGQSIEAPTEGLRSPIGKGEGEGNGNGEGKPADPDPPKPRARNLLADALSTCEGGPVGITPPTWKKIAKALADIRAASPDVTPDEILRRIANYRTHMPDCQCTATAIVNHWATCATAKPAAKAKNAEHSSTIWLDESENRRKVNF
jgi:hypothetical protein